MTEPELIAAVQAQVNDYTDPFEQRIKDAMALGIAQFVSEYQWEFMDVYVSTTTELDTTTGKYKITLPSDFFKPVALSTVLGGPIEYINRTEWLDRQRVSPTSVQPQAYTVIGTDMFLDAAPNASTVEMVYTKNANNVTLNDVPGQYHPAITQAVVVWLMPAVLSGPGGEQTPNPLYDTAQVRYLHALEVAAGLETSNKGRPKMLARPKLAELRSGYR